MNAGLLLRGILQCGIAANASSTTVTTHTFTAPFTALLPHVTRWRGAWLDLASSLLRLARAAVRGEKCARSNRVVVVIIHCNPPPAFSLAPRCE